ncbi:MAG: hypothetical protein N4A35_11355 [Flavobacteriales bacterium]|jgi:hypothetical protein|nr:hypothetical protein [Flavobacteriales bacterium]
MKTNTLLSAIVLLNNLSYVAQVGTPQLPNYTPIQIDHSYPTNQHSQFKTSNTNYQNKALTAQSFIKQQHKARLGNFPQYTPNMTPEERQRENERFINEQLAKQQGYQTPNAQNNFNQLSPYQNKSEYYKQLLTRVHRINQQLVQTGHYNSPGFNNDLPNYQRAKNTLTAMLSGAQPLSIKDALYQIESAYGNLHLSYQQYINRIQLSGKFIKHWLVENRYDLNNPEALHLGIQKFMGDTLYIKGIQKIDGNTINGKQGHTPFFYDFIDTGAVQDFRNYFLTKALATGTGQCHTLPLVYLVLAEEIGAETYLSFSLHHSFIKYKNNKGTIVNYESTIDWSMSDQQYEEEMSTISEGEKNGFYLDTLNKRQIISSFLVDLSYYFQQEHWVHDGSFINDCLSSSAQYFNNQYGNNPEWYYLKGTLLVAQLEQTLQACGITNLEEIPKHPKALKAFKAVQNHEMLIEKLGIQGMPEEVFHRMIEKHDRKGKLQQAKKIDTKSTKNLFFNF